MNVWKMRPADSRKIWMVALVLGAVAFEDETRASGLLEGPGGSVLAEAILDEARRVAGKAVIAKVVLALGRSQVKRIKAEEAVYKLLENHVECP